MPYAEGTKVTVEASVAAIVATIKRAGAQRVAQFEEPDRLAIQFFMNDRMLRFTVRLPNIDDMPKRDGRGSLMSPKAREEKRQRQCRQRARALLLVIKAKLESVASEVETFDEAFLPNIVMADNTTVGEQAIPRIAQAYDSGAAVPLLPGY